MRVGLTTGMYFVACAKAALLKLLNPYLKINEIVVNTPIGIKIVVPVYDLGYENNYVKVCAQKDAGDNAPYDPTHGIEICVKARLINDKSKVIILPERGIGRYENGNLAISNNVLKCLFDNIHDLLEKYGVGLELKIDIPSGENTAKMTLNEGFGIFGGIALLGETGFELPTNNPYVDTRIKHLKLIIEKLRKKGVSNICLTLGSRSYKVAAQILPNDFVVINVGDHIGFTIESILKENFVKTIVIAGCIGKMIKLSGGIYMTYHRYADARTEILIAKLFNYFLMNDEIVSNVIKDIQKCKTVRTALTILDKYGIKRKFLQYLVNDVENRLRKDFKIPDNVCIGVLLIDEHDVYMSNSAKICLKVRM